MRSRRSISPTRRQLSPVQPSGAERRVPPLHAGGSLRAGPPAGRCLRCAVAGRGRTMDAITLLKDDHKTVEALFKRFEKAGDDALRREARGGRQDHRGAVDPRRRRGAALLPGDPGHRARHRGHRAREPGGAPHREVGALRARRHGPGGRALRRQGHRAHRERAPPRRGGGRGVLPEGPRRARPQRPQRPRRRHGGRQGGRAHPPAPPLARHASGQPASSAPPPAWWTASATRSAASPRAAWRRSAT